MQYPVGTGYPITSYFGETGWPRTQPHTGVDFGAPSGTPALPAEPGAVSWTGWNGDWGYTVIVQHAWGETWYSHLSEIWVSAGQQAGWGDVLGLTGATGLVTGPHLHFEIRIGGVPVDPLPYLTGAPPEPPGPGDPPGPGTPPPSPPPVRMPAAHLALVALGIGLLVAAVTE